MTITFVGHGYVGLVTACVFADFGNEVWVIGRTGEKIERLKKGDPLIYEPGLKELLKKNIKASRLHFTLDYKQAIPNSEIVFIAVGTPPKDSGEADLSAIFDVSRNIAKNLKKKLTVVACKSTVPVGTNKKIEVILNKHKSSQSEVAVASCPEFLREGTAIFDTLNPDRIVVGTDSKKAIDLLLKLHQPLNGKRVITDLASAELIKYTANAMLATKISFANLIAFYCEKTGADIEQVLDAVGLDKRIGRVFMNPGVGYGGSCLPKDIMSLVNISASLGIDNSFLKAVETINKQVKEIFLKKILQNIPEKNIAIWGLAFKPNTDDIRFASSIFFIEALLKDDYKITVFDPIAADNIKKIFGKKIAYAENQYQAVKNASGLCIFTEWNDFYEVDFEKLKKLMKHPFIFDGRNLYQLRMMKKLGFKYFSVGRQPIL